MENKKRDQNDEVQQQLIKEGLVRPMAITLKAVVVSNISGKVLLLKRSKRELTNKNKWDLPGGHLEKNQTVKESLKREIEEETGLFVQQGPLLGIAEFKKDHVGFGQEKRGLRFIAYAESEDVKLSKEHDKFEWLEIDDAIDRLSEKDGFEKEKKDVLVKAKERMELEKALDNWKRLLADFDNYKKRITQENEEFRKYSIEGMVHELLPVLDNFEMAIEHAPKEEEESAWMVGILHIKKQLEDVLFSKGVSEIETKVGDKLDESIHEVIGGRDGKGKVSKIMKRGYRLSGKVIRPASVEIE